MSQQYQLLSKFALPGDRFVKRAACVKLCGRATNRDPGFTGDRTTQGATLLEYVGHFRTTTPLV
jgi:hypothetical protein